jgi:hypothetical protein
MIEVLTLRVGNKYSADYVTKLYLGLARNTTRSDWTFRCITESPYPGWWGKTQIFNPKCRTIFLDLDTVIVGNCDFLFEYEEPFALLRDFYRPDGYGSAVMSIAQGYGERIKEGFAINSQHIMGWLHGDQNWIEQCENLADIWQDIYPGKIVSYKADNCDKTVPEGASIVCFHGEPKPYDVANIPWMKEHWR